jgi:hypothetical protein
MTTGTPEEVADLTMLQQYLFHGGQSSVQGRLALNKKAPTVKEKRKEMGKRLKALAPDTVATKPEIGEDKMMKELEDM